MRRSGPGRARAAATTGRHNCKQGAQRRGFARGHMLHAGQVWCPKWACFVFTHSLSITRARPESPDWMPTSHNPPSSLAPARHSHDLPGEACNRAARVQAARGVEGHVRQPGAQRAGHAAAQHARAPVQPGQEELRAHEAADREQDEAHSTRIDAPQLHGSCACGGMWAFGSARACGSARRAGTLS